MATYNQGSITRCYKIERDLIGLLPDQSDVLLYTVPAFFRAKVFIEMIQTGGWYNAKTMRFFHKTNGLLAPHLRRQIDIEGVIVGANQTFVFDDGEKARSTYYVGGVATPPPYTFDMTVGDTLSFSFFSVDGNLDPGERVAFRIRVEETGPAA